ncbi:MAG: (Fe-S)-binding protein [Actinomycetota bacterium]
MFGQCDGCRECIEYCSVFPDLFELLDRYADRDPERMTPAQQDQLVEACHQCRRCVDACGARVGSESAVDVPRAMVRANAMRVARGHVAGSYRRATRTLGRRRAVTRLPRGAAHSLRRRLGAFATGISARRVLRASPLWDGSASHPVPPAGDPQADSAAPPVAVVPTCAVDALAPYIGTQLAAAITSHGTSCAAAAVECCGAAALYGGDLERFAEICAGNVKALIDHARLGGDIVVAERSCAEVLRTYLPDHVTPELRPEAEAVAAAVRDAVAYLDAAGWDVSPSAAPVIVQRSAAPGTADDSLSGLLGRVTGDVAVVDHAVGDAGGWRLRATNDDRVDDLDGALREELAAVPDVPVVVETVLAAGAVAESVDRPVRHVVEWLTASPTPPGAP